MKSNCNVNFADNKILLITAILNIFFSSFIFAGEWVSKSPFNQKVFIENKGQYPRYSNFLDNHIEYFADVDGMQVYFTKEGLTYRYDETIKQDETTLKKLEADGEENEHSFKTLPHFIHMDWEGANPNVEIITEDKVSYYFTYGSFEDKNLAGIKAFGFKKIIYKNLYPRIDVEYIFPENKKGVKYNIILHPGADASLIKMKYSDISKIKLNEGGNISISTFFGQILDNAPLTYYENNSSSVISSKFILKDSYVTFELSPYDNSKSVLIDPWTTVPTFPAYNSAYDVDYDLAGNVYAHGGAGQFSSSKFRIIKFDNTGAIQWVFAISTPHFSSGGGNLCHYTDFTVDINSGACYIGESFRQFQGARILKIDNSGTLIQTFAGDVRLEEIWKIKYDNFTKKIILGGGSLGTPPNFNDQLNQVAYIDTNLTAMTVANPFSASNGLHDICLMTVDNFGSYYAATTQSVKYPSVLNNYMVKGPTTTLVPNAFLVSNKHSFVETSSIPYINNNQGLSGPQVSLTNGFNGMAVNTIDLYTFDGDSIKRWNKNTGVRIISKSLLSGNMFISGGLATDSCGNVYAGIKNLIIHMDSNLNIIDTIIAPDTVYDIGLDYAHNLYACGQNFVAKYGTSSQMNVAISSGACPQNPTAIATGGFPNYHYTWAPTGGNGVTLIPSSSGTYTVTVSDANCNVQTATITILAPMNLSTTSTSSNGSNNGTTTVNVAGGTPGYSYLWSPVGGTNATASGLASGIYTVTVTDGNGCTQTATATVAFSPGTGIAIQSPSVNEINIYPNPANDQVIITFEDKYNRVLIYDCIGKLVFEKEVSSNSLAIDISSYDKGLYFISLQKEGKVANRKFVKQ